MGVDIKGDFQPAAVDFDLLVEGEVAEVGAVVGDDVAGGGAHGGQVIRHRGETVGVAARVGVRAVLGEAFRVHGHVQMLAALGRSTHKVTLTAG